MSNDWQRRQAEKCPCKGHDDMCPCQNVDFSLARGSFNPEIHVPGLWRCAKCNFTLVQSNLNAADGTVTARDEPGDKCPNDGSPLWRVTWRDHAKEAGERIEVEIPAGARMREALKAAAERFREYEFHYRAKLALFEAADVCEHCGTDGWGDDHDSDCPNHPAPLVTDEGPPIFFADMRAKAECNREMAELCEAALASAA